MKIAVCDDTLQCRTEILEFIHQYRTNRPERQIELSMFGHGEDLLQAVYNRGGYDIYILDIVMPDINGIELGQKLRSAGYDGKIIYLTSSVEFAVASYQVKAFHYLVKPVQQEAFAAALDEAFALQDSHPEKAILVKTKDDTRRITLNSILYAELNRRAVRYHLADGRIVESVTIRVPFQEAMQELLDDSRFVLCGKSMIANLIHLTMVESEALVFKENFVAYPGVKICREIRSVWSDFWLNRKGIL